MINVLKNTLLLFFLAIFLASCSGLKGFEKVTAGSELGYSQKAPLSGNYRQALYKAQMDAFGRHFSGIFLIKPVIEDSSFRVVLLSEFGLNLMDLSLSKDTLRVVNCEEFLNRKAVINSIANDISMLLFVPGGVKNTKKFINQETGVTVYKMKHKAGRDFLFLSKTGQISRIEKRKGVWNRLSADIFFENQPFPSSIVFKSKPVKHTMKLTLLNLEK